MIHLLTTKNPNNYFFLFPLFEVSGISPKIPFIPYLRLNYGSKLVRRLKVGIGAQYNYDESDQQG